MTANPLNKTTFSIVDAIKGVNYPSENVDVYLDNDAAHEIHLLEARIADLTNADEVNALDGEISVLKERLLASKLTFELRGISRGLQLSIEKEFGLTQQSSDAEWASLGHAYLAAHIVSVTNAEGAVDEHLFTKEEAQGLEDMLPRDQFAKIYGKMNELSFAAAYIDQAVSADFLSMPLPGRKIAGS